MKAQNRQLSWLEVWLTGVCCCYYYYYHYYDLKGATFILK